MPASWFRFCWAPALALLLYPYLSNSSVSFTAFSLFLGVSMSVTAFPVLARILTDRGIHKTKMGVLTLACAAIDDVTAWCLLGVRGQRHGPCRQRDPHVADGARLHRGHALSFAALGDTGQRSGWTAKAA